MMIESDSRKPGCFAVFCICNAVLNGWLKPAYVLILRKKADPVGLSPKEEEGSDQGESPFVKAEEIEDLEEKPQVTVPAVFCRPFEPVSFNSRGTNMFLEVNKRQIILDNAYKGLEPVPSHMKCPELNYHPSFFLNFSSWLQFFLVFFFSVRFNCNIS